MSRERVNGEVRNGQISDDEGSIERFGLFKVYKGRNRFVMVERRLPVTLIRNKEGRLWVGHETDEQGREITVIYEGSV